MYLIKCVLSFTCVVFLVPQSMFAQTVSGRLVDGLARVPIDKAVIVLLDDAGSELDRALTNPLGQFSFTVPEAGTFKLRSERIGFRAGFSDPFEIVSNGSHEIEMLVNPVVIRLDTLTVSGDAKRCRVVGEQGLETATVWEEARKALTGVAWGESRQVFTYEIRYFNRYFEDNGRLDHEQATTVRRARVMPFSNPDASKLQQSGYAIERGELEDSSEYYAPDAAVFFSEVFLQHHCFKLTRDDDLEGLVGLQFEPTRGRDVPDVKGTLWLDEETAELRRMELSYTNLRSHIRRRHARAEVEFARLETGTWFVQRWLIHMPIVRVDRPIVGGPTRRREQLFGFKEEGSEVLKVLGRRHEVLFEAEPSDSGRGRQ
jgi:hypothetical protein